MSSAAAVAFEADAAASDSFDFTHILRQPQLDPDPSPQEDSIDAEAGRETPVAFVPPASPQTAPEVLKPGDRQGSLLLSDREVIAPPPLGDASIALRLRSLERGEISSQIAALRRIHDRLTDLRSRMAEANRRTTR